MPKMSKKYCKKTPLKNMGFSQKASCKAQGFIKRTSKKYKDKYIKSQKYKKSNENGKSKSRTKTGYRNAQKSRRNFKKY